jgi:hypothetical protein
MTEEQLIRHGIELFRERVVTEIQKGYDVIIDKEDFIFQRTLQAVENIVKNLQVDDVEKNV